MLPTASHLPAGGAGRVGRNVDNGNVEAVGAESHGNCLPEPVTTTGDDRGCHAPARVLVPDRASEPSLKLHGWLGVSARAV